MVEASFADLRHGGDGNLSHAYRLAKTVSFSAQLMNSHVTKFDFDSLRMNLVQLVSTGAQRNYFCSLIYFGVMMV